MAGIAPQPKQGDEELGDEEGMAPNASPEEQDQYEQFVLGAMALIYEGNRDKAQVRPGILKLLDNDPSDLAAILKTDGLKEFSPLVAIAATTVVVTLQVVEFAGDEKPSDEVTFHAGAAILEELCEIWMRANKQQLGEDDVHKALSMAADLYREVAADKGLVDENALKDEFAKLVKADQSGNLASISPDLAGINQAAQINMDQGDDPEEQQEPTDNPQEEEEEQA